MAELVVALDYPESGPALALARDLAGEVSWFKVGSALFTAEGPSVVGRLRDLGCKVFLDLKFMDIPNTVRGAVASAARCGANMTNIHLLGGADMIDAALEGRGDAGKDGDSLTLLGVTVLTSMDESDFSWANLGETTIKELVVTLALNGAERGIDGVVCSAREAQAVKSACGQSFVCLTPGIRPIRPRDDQKRVTTPAAAAQAGSDYLVVGRPVTRPEGATPLEAARAIMLEVEQAGTGSR